MILRFVRPFLSIGPFAETEIPDFAVLTGLNGAGKSHLLSAITQKHVVVEGIESTKIARFSHDNFRIQGETEINAQQLENEAQQVWNFFSQQVQPHSVGWLNVVPGGADGLYDPDLSSLYSAKVEQFINANPHIRQQVNSEALMRTIRVLRKPLHEVDRSLFLRAYKPSDVRPDSLPTAIGKIFVDYQRKLIENDVIKTQNERLDENEPFLSKEEFIALHGPAPWDIIDNILAGFNTIQYRVTNPARMRYFENFRLQLKSVDTPDLIINFEDLSSGEKILMALVVLVYKQATSGTFPDLVLLDEIDASLHPSMTRNMLSVIQAVFVSRGTKVILVTHSPSTIALTPEDSIYVVNRTGVNRIEKKTQAEALRILTEGFATLEEGLLIFDRSTTSELAVLTEGYNTIYIKEALRHFGVSNVNVIDGLEAISGDGQLRTLYDFFMEMPHRNKVLFVWDCDSKRMKSLPSSDTTIPFVFEVNPGNTFARKGIENLLPEHLCNQFPKTIRRYDGREDTCFDENAKRALEAEVQRRNTPSDFEKFKPLIDLICTLQTGRPEPRP